ncbi:MAG TPA: hypothetical protein VHC90_24070 [Bryobacteraceae bacterium]|nr:hypothetical protein [Bryobacteraceae bacterium]
MRTTIEIPDELMRNAKKRAADEGTSLRAVVETALRQHLSGGAQTDRKFRLKLTPHPKGRLLPGVVLEDRDMLYEIMEGRR